MLYAMNYTQRHCTTVTQREALTCRAEAKAHKLDQYRKEAHEVRQLEQDLSLDYPHGLPVRHQTGLVTPVLSTCNTLDILKARQSS